MEKATQTIGMTTRAKEAHMVHSYCVTAISQLAAWTTEC